MVDIKNKNKTSSVKKTPKASTKSKAEKNIKTPKAIAESDEKNSEKSISELSEIEGYIENDEEEIEFLDNSDSDFLDEFEDDEDEGSTMGEPKNSDHLQEIISGDDFNEEEADAELEPDPEEDDEEEEEVVEEVVVEEEAKSKISKADKAKSKKAKSKNEEWSCSSCFMKVTRGQFGDLTSPLCPQGQSPCPIIDKEL